MQWNHSQPGHARRRFLQVEAETPKSAAPAVKWHRGIGDVFGMVRVRVPVFCVICVDLESCTLRDLCEEVIVAKIVPCCPTSTFLFVDSYAQ